jgi:hypothetical protein
MRNLTLFVATLVLGLLSACVADGPANLGYDPAANPAVALATAQQEAAKVDKRVLIIAGGDWCRWCHVLNSFLSENKDVKFALDDAFVVIKVYAGDDDTNEDFFAGLPPADGYPHFWVVKKDGTARSIGTGALESGDDSYDRAKFLTMIRNESRR